MVLETCNAQDCVPTSQDEEYQTSKVRRLSVGIIGIVSIRSSSLEVGEENLPAEYLEIVNFVNSGWSSVKVELEQGERQAVERT